ncbi:hypothetical protein KC19_9G084100 [Ceratodon purpureus]|uniref:Uncharacterized protein n=1 Tax=Ceratodon purpureus TaxID=3225 RepID=A0A8T0GVH2_CERPU|nr:hypothetical protein KC19_9G084100 [Ceratodon purpureus]
MCRALNLTVNRPDASIRIATTAVLQVSPLNFLTSCSCHGLGKKYEKSYHRFALEELVIRPRKGTSPQNRRKHHSKEEADRGGVKVRTCCNEETFLKQIIS